MITMQVLKGAELDAALEDVARLRIKVFADWPYLYSGDLSYEARYLNPYRDNARAIIIAAYADGEMVGASTGMPLCDHQDGVAETLQVSGYPPQTIFYCAESVLLPEFRGHGLGHRFFEEREAHARRLGFTYSCFCSVIRPTRHPKRPDNYRQLDAFWNKRGYRRLPEQIATLTWVDIGEASETEKRLQFWGRSL